MSPQVARFRVLDRGIPLERYYFPVSRRGLPSPSISLAIESSLAYIEERDAASRSNHSLQPTAGRSDDYLLRDFNTEIPGQARSSQRWLAPSRQAYERYSHIIIVARSIDVRGGDSCGAEQAIRARDEAVAKKDAATWDRLTTSDFITVRPDGKLMKKAERLAQLMAEEPQARPKPKQEQFIRYGDTVLRQLQAADGTLLD